MEEKLISTCGKYVLNIYYNHEPLKDLNTFIPIKDEFDGVHIAVAFKNHRLVQKQEALVCIDSWSHPVEYKVVERLYRWDGKSDIVIENETFNKKFLDSVKKDSIISWHIRVTHKRCPSEFMYARLYKNKSKHNNYYVSTKKLPNDLRSEFVGYIYIDRNSGKSIDETIKRLNSWYFQKEIDIKIDLKKKYINEEDPNDILIKYENVQYFSYWKKADENIIESAKNVVKSLEGYKNIKWCGQGS
jgi:hypothetical protein